MIRIQFQEMKEMGTLEEYLTERGFVMKGNRIPPQKEIVGFEKSVVPIGI